MKKRTLNDMKRRIAMDKILDAMDKALTKVQKEFHVFVVDRKIKKFEKKMEKKITYVSDWLEAKLS
jgi:hypothetical protein